MQELLGPLPAWMEALGFPMLGRLLLATVLGAAIGLRAEPLSMRRDPESAEYRYTISGAADRLSELLHRLAGTDGVRGVAIE